MQRMVSTGRESHHITASGDLHVQGAIDQQAGASHLRATAHRKRDPRGSPFLCPAHRHEPARVFQRRRSESNRRMRDLQSPALPLGYGADNRQAERAMYSSPPAGDTAERVLDVLHTD